MVKKIAPPETKVSQVRILKNDLLKLLIKSIGGIAQTTRGIKKTIIFVTHDIFEAFAISDRIAIMDKGKIIQIGTPKEIAEKPTNEFVKKFIGKHLKALLIELNT